jgi:hypothetical protein
MVKEMMSKVKEANKNNNDNYDNNDKKLNSVQKNKK